MSARRLSPLASEDDVHWVLKARGARDARTRAAREHDRDARVEHRRRRALVVGRARDRVLVDHTPAISTTRAYDLGDEYR